MATDYLYTEGQVREMWKRTKEEQYQIAQAKCIEAITHTDGELYVSFSGGKDSAVVLFIMAQMWSITKKDKPLRVAFANTTNEYICAAAYRKSYINWIEEKFGIQIDYQEVRADSSYFDVVEQEGFPFISKKVSKLVRTTKETLSRLGLKYSDIQQYMPAHFSPTYKAEMIAAADKLRSLGFNDTAVLALTKIRSDNYIGNRFLPLKYRPLLDTDSFTLSEKCCNILKKAPITKMQEQSGGLLPVTGEMAVDSRDRMEAYRLTGCNMFSGDKPKSKPIGPMTEQAVLWVIKEFQIPILPVYGQVEYLDDGETLHLTGEQRTGCKLCGFGIMYDWDRFIRLNEIEPQVVKFAFTSLERGGLGYKQICQFLNDNCQMKIGIPDIEEGYYRKRAEKYANSHSNHE